jgi:hypothetical protein
VSLLRQLLVFAPELPVAKAQGTFHRLTGLLGIIDQALSGTHRPIRRAGPCAEASAPSGDDRMPHPTGVRSADRGPGVKRKMGTVPSRR